MKDHSQVTDGDKALFRQNVPTTPSLPAASPAAAEALDESDYMEAKIFQSSNNDSSGRLSLRLTYMTRFRTNSLREDALLTDLITTTPQTPESVVERRLRRAVEDEDASAIDDSEGTLPAPPMIVLLPRAPITHNAPGVPHDRPPLPLPSPQLPPDVTVKTNAPIIRTTYGPLRGAVSASASSSPTKRAFESPARNLTKSKSMTRLITMFGGNREASMGSRGSRTPSPTKPSSSNHQASTGVNQNSVSPTKTDSRATSTAGLQLPPSVIEDRQKRRFPTPTVSRNASHQTLPASSGKKLTMDRLTKNTYLKDFKATQRWISSRKSEAAIKAAQDSAAAIGTAPQQRGFRFAPQAGEHNVQPAYEDFQVNLPPRSRAPTTQETTLSFSKMPLGPQLNPNPRFFRDMPPQYHEGMPQYWQWLAEHDLLDISPGGSLTVRVPGASQTRTQDPAFQISTAAGPSDAQRNEHNDNIQIQDELQDRIHDLDGTDEREFDNKSTLDSPSTPTGTPPKSQRRRVSFSPIVSSSSTGNTPTGNTPTRRNRVSSILTGSPLRRRGDSGSSILARTEPIVMEQQPRVYPVIVQVGRPTALEAADQNPNPYKRSWAEVANPLAKLTLDDSIEEYEKRKSAITSGASLHSLPLLELSEAIQPEGDPEPEKAGSKLRMPFTPKHKTSFSIPKLFDSTRDADVDTQPIYVTPPDQRPTYPRPGTNEYYKAMTTQPFFAFDGTGYITRSGLTKKLVFLFRDPVTAPEWAFAVPDYYSQRAADTTIDLSVDSWVHYWETLVVKADLRRGCRLATKAAQMLVEEKEEELKDTLERAAERARSGSGGLFGR